MSLALKSAALVAALSCLASVAFAHAPLPRGLAVAPNGSGAIAVRMPGFGWLLRDPASFEGEAVFGYACDALLGVSPAEERAPMAYRSDGTLLVGTAHGLRLLAQDGCPESEIPLSGQSVTALAIHSTQVERAYAITEATDVPPTVQRSDDGGQSWTMAAQLAPHLVTALVLDEANPQMLYVSQKIANGSSSVAKSSDGGASFTTFEPGRELTLVHAQAAPRRLWAMARVPNTPAGVAILRAEQAEGPWDEVLIVNFFGGLAIDPNDADVIWVGDEARGVFRSDDGGDSFEETQPSIASACLAYGAGALWSCTPGTPEHTALVRSSDALEAFEPIMAFADVTQLVDCAPSIDVAQVCAPAWIEWQRDVIGVTPSLPDAGSAELDASTMGEPDAAIEARDVGPPRDPDSGCTVSAPQRNASPAWLLLAGVAIALRGLRRRPRGCGPRACPRTAARLRAPRAPTATQPRSRPRVRS